MASSSSMICPACRAAGFQSRTEHLDIPYFGEVIEFVVTCDACGFRRADFFVARESEPVRYEFTVEAMADLNARVVRSASGHFEIPELGIRAEPSEAADAFVSNVEGVLVRCRDAIQMALNWAETDEERTRAEGLLEKVARLADVAEPWTLRIEDAAGNSAIIHERAVRTVLSKADADRLGYGFLVIDAADLRDDGPQDEA